MPTYFLKKKSYNIWFVVLFVFLGPYLRYVEVPRLAVW